MQNFFVLVLCVSIVQLNGCVSDGHKDTGTSYVEQIKQFRTEKDKFFKHETGSPLPSEIKEEFNGLDYFPVNADFRIMAEFLAIPGRSTLNISLNNGRSQLYIRHGYATFQKDTLSVSLLVLKPVSGKPNELFVPFFDKTSGFATYGGGRYLEPTQVGDSKILLDFNKAYNPFCAYSPEYVCPLPPKENFLPISIEAGEKTLEKH